jgi:glyoxylase-like metal-dependent hydrolase (beta-lactamase superfamily II)
MPHLVAQDPRWLSNAWLVWDAEQGQAVLVDTGAPLQRLLSAIAAHGLRLAAVLTTHRHHDHVAGHAEAARLGAVILAHPLEAPHVPGAQAVEPESTHSFGGLHAQLVPLPGHTAGHSGWFLQGSGLFTGDALFRGSIGGTVGPGSSGFADQRASVERILGYPAGTALLPGHGPETTVGLERDANALARAILGLDSTESRPARALSRPVRVLRVGRDYDGGTKVWVRFDDDGTDAIVPGSRVEFAG